MRSWGSVYQLLPRGGSLIWGDPRSGEPAPDDLYAQPVCKASDNATPAGRGEAAAAAGPGKPVPATASEQDEDEPAPVPGGSTAPMPSIAGMVYIGDRALSVDEALALFLNLDPLNASSATRQPPLGDHATEIHGNRVSFGHRPRPRPGASDGVVPRSHRTCGHDEGDDLASRSWGNPLEHPLPRAPNLKVPLRALAKAAGGGGRGGGW